MRENRMQQEYLAKLLIEHEKRIRYNKLKQYYPDNGNLSRDKYPKHIEFFRSGREYRERLALCANRVGKTEGMGGVEMVYHLLGEYPDWWPGRKFDRPIAAVAAGDTGQTVRDTLQIKLLGTPSDIGTGLIPKDAIAKTRPKAGSVADAVESVEVVWRGDKRKRSRLILKSYDQKRKAFQGTEVDVAWMDEEPPIEVYTEAVMRTMTTNGIVMSTFTPLLGMSEVVRMFLPEGRLAAGPVSNSRYVVMASWDDAPHLSEETRKELWESIPPYQREARSQGIPQLGSGAVYPISEESYIEDNFEIPAWWPQCYGLDVGWNSTAAVWAAIDPATDTIHIHSEYKRGMAEPAIHAAAINARGTWIPGAIDPASMGSSQADGKKLINCYAEQGLNVHPADNSVEAGIQRTWLRLSTGKLKIFQSCRQLIGELRMYRRDERGNIVKENDHLADAMRYLVSTGIMLAIPKPDEDAYRDYMATQHADRNMVSQMTGY